MKKISEEDIRKLKSQGVKVRNQNGSVVVSEEPFRLPPKKEDNLSKIVTKVIYEFGKIVQANTTMLVKAIKEEKPKPKRKTRYKINYKNKQIDTVDATEL